MKLAKLDSNGDWVFGRGSGNYITAEGLIEQNLVTCLKCFANDWFLNIEEHIDWDYILSIRNNQDIIELEIARVALNCTGVISINYIDVNHDIANRKLNINLNVVTIYNKDLNIITGLDL